MVVLQEVNTRRSAALQAELTDEYPFHSNDFEAVAAHLAKFDGVLDHRGVVVGLALKPR